MKQANDSNIIRIPFDPERSPREQLQSAIATVRSRSCHHHPHEILAVDQKATLLNALCHDSPYEDRPWHLEFDANYARCAECPHSSNDFEIEVENCAVPPRMFGRRPFCTKDKEGKPLPKHLGSAVLVADQSARQQFDSWLMGEFRCQFSNQPLERLDARWKLPFESWSMEPQFDPCPQCALEHLGITPDEARASFDNLVIDPPELQHLSERCRAFAANPEGVLFLLGNVGTGKTHLAISILRERLRRGAYGLKFVKHRHFLARHWLALRPVAFREAPPESPLASCQATPLLVYDEFTPSTDSRTHEDVLLDLFEKRNGNFKPSIITANLSRGELEAALGSRLFDRLRRVTFAVLEFGFASKRQSLNADYLNRSRAAVRT